jgi:hypothetical protein
MTTTVGSLVKWVTTTVGISPEIEMCSCMP